MGTKHNDPCIKNAAEDEPLFVLRATDRLAPGIIQEWISRAAAAGVEMGKIQQAQQTFRDVILWQRQHPESVHTPD